MPSSKKRRKTWRARKTRRWIWIALTLLSVVVGALLAYQGFHGTSVETAISNRAAILDGLGIDFPNKTFIDSATRILEEAGFTVDVYGSENVTLNLLKSLPSKKYSLVIFRVHGGRIRQPIGLFIGGGLFVERCGPESHREEVESGYLLLGRPFLSNHTYCVAPPHYISDKLKGRFTETLVIAMSCFTGDDRVMADAFFSKGAGAYLGFKGEVSPQYVDAFTIRFLEKVYLGKLSPREAFEEVLEEMGVDKAYGGEPVLYLP